MTTERRRYIIIEHFFHGRKFNEIADELGISKQAISNDRSRHKEEWDTEKRWLEFWIKGDFNKCFSECMKKSRAYLKGIIGRIEHLDEMRSDLAAAVKNNFITPEDFVKFSKQLDEFEFPLMEAEKRLCIWLTQLHEKKDEIRNNPVERLKDLRQIELDPLLDS